MPFLKVHLTAQSDAEDLQRIATAMSALTAQHLSKDPMLTAVAITLVDPRQWWIGSQSLDQLGKSSFALDIKVTSGTNTKAEIARFIEAVFAAMRGLLGQVHPTSYIVVHEVLAASWGYAGVTQEYRFIAKRLAAET